jgi:hypothetical protein
MEYNMPKLWKDMTDAEKGTLLLAQYEGKNIQFTKDGKIWFDAGVLFCDEWAYRVKAEPNYEVEQVRLINQDGIIIGHGTIMTRNGTPDYSTLHIEKM